ncbi:hypothetical protein EMPS_10141 [Entomortierella parvispora]|uniref:Carboxylesterase type B domain-containing protein n=1 Tax=Entomortierella parvispora TaxID=205924 RepID=A0A9P3M117_9FUNG|nr:hypothetical protein EMPS_10141 [Entomortierella parvispora]
MILKNLVAVVTAAILASQTLFTAAAPVEKINKRTLLPTAPLASDVNGAHLLIINDVDSANIIKNAYILLSQPRDYYSGMSMCTSMGDGGYIYIPGTSGATDLVSLLNSNAPAQPEVEAYSQYWVYNGVPGVFGNCLAVNKNTGNTDWIPCTTELPSVCFNSVMRRVLLFDDTSRQVKVNTPVGQIQGWRDQNAFRFLGIPYAEAPVGDLRFAAPVAKAPFNSTWDAIEYKGICPQTALSTGVVPIILSYLENSATEMEDCLNLNVYTPSLKGEGATLLPVLMYIHGGGFVNNSGSIIIFEPGNMVSRGGVVVVTINYRLGMLGWMENINAWDRNTVPGNQAIRDQILALQWIQKNIASFGGDPNMVTVFGESAGGTSIRALLSAPSAWGLYKRVAGESDPHNIPYMLPSDAATMSNYFMEQLGCAVNDLACARSKSQNDLLEAQLKSNAQVLAQNKWVTFALIQRPVTDGDLIPADFSELVKAGKYNTEADIMWGTVHDEAGLFVPQYFPNPVPIANASWALDFILDPNRTAIVMNSPYFTLDPSDPDAVRNAFTKFGTDYYFLCPLQYLSREMSKIKPTYNFRFDRGRDIPLVGQNYCSSSTGRVCHAADIQPVFASGDAIPFISQTGDDARFARQVVDRWTTFAKTGNPNPKPGMPGFELTNPDVTSVTWVPFDDSNPIIDLNVTSAITTNNEETICNWTDTVFLYDFWIEIPNNMP